VVAVAELDVGGELRRPDRADVLASGVMIHTPPGPVSHRLPFTSDAQAVGDARAGSLFMSISMRPLASVVSGLTS